MSGSSPCLKLWDYPFRLAFGVEVLTDGSPTIPEIPATRTMITIPLPLRFVNTCIASSKECDERCASDSRVLAGKCKRSSIPMDFERRDAVAALVAHIEEISSGTELEMPGVVSHGRYLIDMLERAIGGN